MPRKTPTAIDVIPGYDKLLDAVAAQIAERLMMTSITPPGPPMTLEDFRRKANTQDPL